MNYLLILSYDGTNYCGFQIQPNGRSVAQTFQDGLEAVLGTRPDIKGCSRTDAGVHALGFALNFHADTRIPPEKLPLALNQHLPPDIRVLSARIVPEDFHARYAAHTRPTSTASTTAPSIRPSTPSTTPACPGGWMRQRCSKRPGSSSGSTIFWPSARRAARLRPTATPFAPLQIVMLCEKVTNWRSL